MPWLRRHGRRLILLHSVRADGHVRQLRLGSFRGTVEITPAVRHDLEARYPAIKFNWRSILGPALVAGGKQRFRVVREISVDGIGPLKFRLSAGAVLAPHPEDLDALRRIGAELEVVGEDSAKNVVPTLSVVASSGGSPG